MESQTISNLLAACKFNGAMLPMKMHDANERRHHSCDCDQQGRVRCQRDSFVTKERAEIKNIVNCVQLVDDPSTFVDGLPSTMFMGTLVPTLCLENKFSMISSGSHRVPQRKSCNVMSSNRKSNWNCASYGRLKGAKRISVSSLALEQNCPRRQRISIRGTFSTSHLVQYSS